MSEWRQVKTCFKLSEKESLIQACEEIDLNVKENGRSIFLTNHNLDTYIRDQAIVFNPYEEEYFLSGDCESSELEKISTSIKRKFSEIVIMNTMKNMGYYQESRTGEEKIKIVLRSY